MRYYLKKHFKIMICCCVMVLMAVVSMINSSAVTLTKSLVGGYSTTSISVPAKYYTHETKRWGLGTAVMVGSGGRGGGSSKVGGMSTRQSGAKYYMSQKYKISATDWNYNTVSGTRTFQWCMNGPSNSWVSSECYVK